MRNAYVCRCLTNQDITGGGGSDLYVRVNALKDVQSSLTRYVTVTKYEQKDLSDRQVLLILFELFFEAHDDYRAYKQSSCDLYGLGEEEGEGGRGEGGGGRGVEMGGDLDMDDVGAALRRRGGTGTGTGGGGGMKASSLSLIGRHVSSPLSFKMPSSPSSPSPSSSPPSSSFFAGLGPFSGTSTSPFSSASSDAMSSTSTSPPSNPLAHTRSHAHVLAHALSYLPSSQPTSAKYLRQEKEEINNDDENVCEKEIMKNENSKKKIGEESDVTENNTKSENDEIYNDKNMDTRNEIEKEREVGQIAEKAEEEKSDKNAKKKNATLFTESLKSVTVGAATTPKKQNTPSPGGLIRVQCSPLRLFTRSPHRRKIETAVGVVEEKEEGRGGGDGGGGGEGEIDEASLLAGEGEGEKEERVEGVYNTSVSMSASLSEERGEDRNGGGGGGGRVESTGYSLSLPPIYSESDRIVRIQGISADVAELSDGNLDPHLESEWGQGRDGLGGVRGVGRRSGGVKGDRRDDGEGRGGKGDDEDGEEDGQKDARHLSGRNKEVEVELENSLNYSTYTVQSMKRKQSLQLLISDICFLIQVCVGVSSLECRKKLAVLFSDLPGDTDKYVSLAFLHSFRSPVQSSGAAVQSEITAKIRNNNSSYNVSSSSGEQGSVGGSVVGDRGGGGGGGGGGGHFNMSGGSSGDNASVKCSTLRDSTDTYSTNNIDSISNININNNSNNSIGNNNNINSGNNIDVSNSTSSWWWRSAAVSTANSNNVTVATANDSDIPVTLSKDSINVALKSSSHLTAGTGEEEVGDDVTVYKTNFINRDKDNKYSEKKKFRSFMEEITSEYENNNLNEIGSLNELNEESESEVMSSKYGDDESECGREIDSDSARENSKEKEIEKKNSDNDNKITEREAGRELEIEREKERRRERERPKDNFSFLEWFSSDDQRYQVYFSFYFTLFYDFIFTFVFNLLHSLFSSHSSF